MTSTKKVIGQLHLIVGLISGLVVFIVSITGAIYAYEHEIQEITQPYRFVENVLDNSLPPSKIKEIAEEALPNTLVQRVYYESPQNSSMALHFEEGKEYYYLTFIDQYTGEVLKTKNLRQDFFTIILYIHISLLLPYGKEIIGICTLLFSGLLVSGIILWWPKNKSKKAIKQKFKIKWDARWRRQNYDLHSVLGFYASWILIFTVITGLVWSFSWFETGVYFLLSGGEKLDDKNELKSRPTVDSSEKTIDIAWESVINDSPEMIGGVIYIPNKKEDIITIYTSPEHGTYGKLDWRYFDQYSGKELNYSGYRGRYKNASPAEKILRLNYDIHTGGIFGIVGKTIMFFISLISSSLPITGFLLWRGRRKKKKAKPKKILETV
ncbi:PepSY-associated TM helix domain-containing protein [Flammeovirga sp. SubArs3]|uniref:PepSY-associated TM helix domain-containing protein n=1 Tax=Flammeovirga sp. SubArs3 TaxID=2995316 RepID=UPI00248B51AC|nr:PepSY-associated TM helix domain-containing protein [Flammeovirga sp. SubArs3]